MGEMDDVAMKQEIMLEAYAGILADFRTYFNRKGIDPYTAPDTPEIHMFLTVRRIKMEILNKTSLQELNEIVGQFKLLKVYVEALEQKTGK